MMGSKLVFERIYDFLLSWSSSSCSSIVRMSFLFCSRRVRFSTDSRSWFPKLEHLLSENYKSDFRISTTFFLEAVFPSAIGSYSPFSSYSPFCSYSTLCSYSTFCFFLPLTSSSSIGNFLLRPTFFFSFGSFGSFGALVVLGFRCFGTFSSFNLS